ncbi:MAG: GAF domain-containing protein [Catalinimonas sp.]
MSRLRRLSTIHGRITLMMTVCVAALLVFSAFVTYQTREIKRSYGLLIHAAHDLDISRFIHGGGFVMSQCKMLEGIMAMDSAGHDQAVADIIQRKDKFLERAQRNLVMMQAEDYQPAIDTLTAVWNDMEALQHRLSKITGATYPSEAARTAAQQEAAALYEAGMEPIIQRFYQIVHGELKRRTVDQGNAIRARIEFWDTMAIYLVISVSVLICLCVVGIWMRTRRSLTRSIARPSGMLQALGEGALPKPQRPLNNELDTLVTAANQLSTSLRSASHFAQAVGEGNFEHEFKALSERDELGNALLHMRDEIRTLTEREAARRWVSQGQSEVAELLRASHVSQEELAGRTLSWIVRYVEANQGALFVYQPDEEHLTAVACYAYERRKYVERTVAPGEGLVGQCFLEREPTYLTEVPTDYVHITSGTGEAPPRNLMLVPLLVDEQVEGVLELAAFRVFTDAERTLITGIAASLASFLTSSRAQKQTDALLTELQEKSAQLSSQEEELQQNLEEMQASHEEMRRREEQYKRRIAALEAERTTPDDAPVTA